MERVECGVDVSSLIGWLDWVGFKSKAKQLARSLFFCWTHTHVPVLSSCLSCLALCRPFSAIKGRGLAVAGHTTARQKNKSRCLLYPAFAFCTRLYCRCSVGFEPKLIDDEAQWMMIAGRIYRRSISAPARKVLRYPRPQKGLVLV